MRYNTITEQPMTVYSEAESLHFMLNFTVFLGLIIGVILWFLGRNGRVLWLQVWSVGLVLSSVAYLLAAVLGYIR
jgi:hypothetical protein